MLSASVRFTFQKSLCRRKEMQRLVFRKFWDLDGHYLISKLTKSKQTQPHWYRGRLQENQVERGQVLGQTPLEGQGHYPINLA